MNTGIWLGLATGIIFGFLLQKARVLRFEKQIGALLLKDMTILKFMLSAILVGMIGIMLLTGFGLISASHKPMNVGGVVLGGFLFGVGWSVTGYCPGTSIGALGEGRWHAAFAVLGMIAGSAVYALLYPFMNSTVLAWKNFGPIWLPDAIGLSPWLVIGVFGALVLLLSFWFEQKGV